MPTNSTETILSPAAPRRFDTLGLEFDCICIEVRSDVSQSPQTVVQSAVTTLLGPDWSIAETDDSHEFDVTCSSQSLVYRQYWEFCYSLVAHDDIEFAYPEFHPFAIPERAVSSTGLEIGHYLSYSVDGNEADPSLTVNKGWALNQCRVSEGWQVIRNDGRKPGEGIKIGHPDLGYRIHAEMDRARIDENLQWDFVRSVRSPVSPNGNHGLGTASVIMSGESGEIKGPALHSTIVPLRVKKNAGDVVLGYWDSYRRLRRALVYSEDNKFDLISISLGGAKASYRKRVRKRLIKLNRKGVIIVAAAGNRVQFGRYFTRDKVVFPARWPETIAVAATTVERKSWVGSCRGKKVDISAPGDSVWRAIIDEETGLPNVVRHAGTSFATAMVAGIAAMWRAYRQTELANVDPEKIPVMFKKLIKSTAQTDHQLSAGSGAGIIDAEALLKAPLPTVEKGVDQPPVNDPVDLPGISDQIGFLKNDLLSLKSIDNSKLETLSTFEAYELEAALELEMWYHAVNETPATTSFLEELTPALAQKLRSVS